MREIVFRTLAGSVSALSLFGAVLMVKGEDYKPVVLIGAMGLLFGAYAAFGEYRIRWLLRMIGAKDGTSQKSGGSGFGV